MAEFVEILLSDQFAHPIDVLPERLFDLRSVVFPAGRQFRPFRGDVDRLPFGRYVSQVVGFQQVEIR